MCTVRGLGIFWVSELCKLTAVGHGATSSPLLCTRDGGTGKKPKKKKKNPDDSPSSGLQIVSSPWWGRELCLYRDCSSLFQLKEDTSTVGLCNEKYGYWSHHYHWSVTPLKKTLMIARARRVRILLQLLKSYLLLLWCQLTWAQTTDGWHMFAESMLHFHKNQMICTTV